MKFEKSNKSKKIAQKLGYLFSYLIFTTILFIILKLLNKLPDSWTYIDIAIITILIVILGNILKKILK
ncbi:hypothetical protein FJZ19_01005 [Candidatus Pacearchaeota archaeon]|nr:hypothetical protein [Candidatus Pacearchaeota archaeon]